MEYPTPSGMYAGQADSSASADESYTYDLQGETATKTDQDGNVHTYSYDVLGHLTLDAVTTLGSGVDGSIRALGYTYTAMDLPFQQTSYSNSGGTTVVNQVDKEQDVVGDGHEQRPDLLGEKVAAKQHVFVSGDEVAPGRVPLPLRCGK